MEGTPELVRTLAEIQQEAARAVDMLLLARDSGETRISGVTSLRKIEGLAKDRLTPDSEFSAPAMTGTG